MKRLIIFLVRKRLGVPKHAWFQFTNQKNKREWYTFESDCVMKKDRNGDYVLSGVSLNWLLDDDCKSSIVLA
jgi:hypothetical protein